MGFLDSVSKGFTDVFSPGWEEAKDLVPGIGDARAQERANKENKLEAQINREFQERMSSTAYQRAMDDMKKSGLNPMLAYQQGGASVPSGSQATVQSASKTGLAAAGLQAYTGISAARSQIQNANTAQAQSESSISLQAAQSANALASTEKTQADTVKTIDSIKNQKAQRKLLQNQAKLENVKTSAADMANKGLSTLERTSNALLKNTSKPSVNNKTLKYENPLNPLNWFKKDKK
ncbi:MAG: DNA pilot protein [Wigfec virus K19_141]|nr:MAG: DNA pilot protein [Wigfec virus K19_141]